jgi:hypothetical protein
MRGSQFGGILGTETADLPSNLMIGAGSASRSNPESLRGTLSDPNLPKLRLPAAAHDVRIADSGASERNGQRMPN